MISPGDLLLFAVTAAGSMSWPSFSRTYDALLSKPASPDDGGTGGYPGLRKRRARAMLDALGHCEMVYRSGSSELAAAPALLARLPLRGLPKVVLTGARQPSTIPAVIDACRTTGGVSVLLDDPSGRADVPVPTRVELEAEADRLLEAVALQLGIPYLATPPAWLIACASAAVSDVVARLEWHTGPELNWIRKEFDPAALRLMPGVPPNLPALRLVSYQHRVKPVQRFVLWRGEESAQIDARWGRYAVLAATGRQVLLYDERRNRLAVPASTPLPRLLSRALCLCSGQPPDFVSAAALGTTLAGSWGVHLYSAVSPDIASQIGDKTGQRLQPVSLAHSLEAL
jgi:hypothetical protein